MSRFGNAWKALRGLPTPATGRVRRFDGATVDRLTSAWLSSNTAIDQELRGDLDRLRARSRDLFKNNEYAAKFGRMVRNNVVGPEGFTLQARAADPGNRLDAGANRAIEAAWWRYQRPQHCDVVGKRSFTDLCRSVALALARDGEFLVRLVRGRGEFGLQLQLLDVDRLDTSLNVAAANGRNAVVMGVEMDAYRMPVAYHIRAAAGADGRSQKVERVPAADILHGFMPLEDEQARGVPWLHAAMRILNDLKGYREAAVIAARIGASKMGFFTNKDGAPPPGAETDADGNFVTTVAPGEFEVLPDGYGFEKFDPTYPHEQFDAFCKAALRGTASAIGVAYNGLANDLEGVNFSSIRAGVIDERDEWMVVQNFLITAFLTPVYELWLRMALTAGRITLDNGTALPLSKFDKFAAHQWQGRRWQWVDPLKDIEASVLAISNGLASPQQIAAQSGRDVEDILDDLQVFDQMLKARGLTLGPAPAPAPAADQPPPEKPQPDDAEDARTVAATAIETMGGLAREMAAQLRTHGERPVDLRITQEPMRVHIAQADTHVHIAQERAEAPPAPVVNVTVEPTPVNVNVEPAQVNVELEATMPAPTVTVELPPRRTDTTIKRDSAGRISETTQIERDA